MGIAPTELSFPDGDPADVAVGPLALPSSGGGAGGCAFRAGSGCC